MERFRTTACHQATSLKASRKNQVSLPSASEETSSTNIKPTQSEEPPLAMLEIPLVHRQTPHPGTARHREAEQEATSDLPPSYEEALNMPGPNFLQEAPSENSIDNLDEPSEVTSPRGLLRIDYVNISQ